MHRKPTTMEEAPHVIEDDMEYQCTIVHARPLSPERTGKEAID